MCILPNAPFRSCSSLWHLDDGPVRQEDCWLCCTSGRLSDMRGQVHSSLSGKFDDLFRYLNLNCEHIFSIMCLHIKKSFLLYHGDLRRHRAVHHGHMARVDVVVRVHLRHQGSDCLFPSKGVLLMLVVSTFSRKYVHNIFTCSSPGLATLLGCTSSSGTDTMAGSSSAELAAVTSVGLPRRYSSEMYFPST